MKLGLIGFGGLGSLVAENLARDAPIQFAGIAARPAQVEKIRALLGDVPVVASAPALIALKPDLIVECASHAAFRDKHGLAVRLLADTEGTVCNKYGVWQEKEKDGVKKMGIVRSTFIIDKNGILRHALYGITAKGHAAEVLKLLEAL